MWRSKRLAIAVLLVVGALALLAPAVLAGPSTTATVRFGNDDVGSPFPPITDHDQSGNGKFNLIPRTVTIAAGGSVTYDILIRFGIISLRSTRRGRRRTTSILWGLSPSSMTRRGASR
jgi:hypothetical protein